jgi:hypothetical protein
MSVSADHPESRCEQCGGRNLSWFTSSDRWRAANGWPDNYRDGILCPACFVERWEKATGLRAVWRLMPDESTMRDRGHDAWMAEHLAATESTP